MIWLRWSWRQLTSMRTAVIMLLFLALAAIPGSLLPQRGSAPLRVNQFLRDHTTVGPWLDRLGFFDVFASPWFAAVYILLFVSLSGCVLPRTAAHLREIRALPVEAPRNLSRIENFVAEEVNVPDVVELAAKHLRAKRWRVATGPDWLSAEKGYLRETGNLVFHLSMLVLIVVLGYGSVEGFRATVIVREGAGFANNVTQFDTYNPGRFFAASQLPPFGFKLDDFSATYQRGGMQNGAPRAFAADITLRESPQSETTLRTIRVNEPLRVDGTSVYLVGHGYAPELTVKSADGTVLWQDAVVFLPQDGNFTSTGVIKLPDVSPQLGVDGIFIPTTEVDASGKIKSVFPAADNPLLALTLWQGDLGMDAGRPQSVYTLDKSKLSQIGTAQLAVGQVWDLPDGLGTIEFTGVREWASFSVARNPAEGYALGVLSLVIGGLLAMLLIPRRRIWLRTTGNLVQAAGLGRAEMTDLSNEIGDLLAAVKEK